MCIYIENINYEGYREVLVFKYLSSVVTYDNDCGKDVRSRTTAGNRSYQALPKIMKSCYISKHTKLKIYTTMIKPTALYGCETWAMTEKIKSSLKTWQRKILRKIYGPIKDQNG
jgi:hypothetical protein